MFYVTILSVSSTHILEAPMKVCYTDRPHVEFSYLSLLSMLKLVAGNKSTSSDNHHFLPQLSQRID